MTLPGPVPLLLALAAPSAGDCAALATVPLAAASVDRAARVGDLCQVEGTARPVAGSVIRFALYLPPPARWSGRYYQIGNGGFAGAIHYPTLAEGAARGDAIAGTDTGHVGTGFDASWAAGNRVALDDYGWRSIKATADAAAPLIAAYYGRRAGHRYFMGCSNGGRMALMAAARWPHDWDGVIAGAPANPWTGQWRQFAAIRDALRAPGGWLDWSALDLIGRTARAACPPATLRGGVAQRPPLCRANWHKLRCMGAPTSACLTGPQLRALQTILAAGYQPAALDAADWARWIAQPDPAAPSQATFADQAAAYLYPSFDSASLQAALDIAPHSLAAFRARGGRILSYFGWADAVVAPGLGRAWHRAAVRASGGGNGRDFYRLFMVPGMQHCQGGTGPVSFGQSLAAPATAPGAEYDVRRALERWVEQGEPPRRLRSRLGAREQALRPE